MNYFTPPKNISIVLVAAALMAGCGGLFRAPTRKASSLSGLSDVKVAAGASGTETFTVSGAGALDVSVSSANQTLLADSGITGQGACTATGSCTLTLTPDAGTSGSATVTVGVTDSQGHSASASFVFTENPPPAVSKTIGAAGGEIAFADGRFKLTIPAGALSKDTEITITELSGNDIPTALQDPSTDRAYKIEPVGLQLAAPATIKVVLPADNTAPIAANSARRLNPTQTTTLQGSPWVLFEQSGDGSLAALRDLKTIIQPSETDIVASDFILGILARREISGVYTIVVAADSAVVGQPFDGDLEVLVNVHANVDADLVGNEGVSFTPNVLPDPTITQYTTGTLTLGQGQDIKGSFTDGCAAQGTGILAFTFQFSNVLPKGKWLPFDMDLVDNTSLACMTQAPPPPPPPPPPATTTTPAAVPVGLHALPETQSPFIKYEGMTLLFGFIPVQSGSAQQHAQLSAVGTSTGGQFGPLAGDGGPIAVFAGSSGEAVVDLATNRLLLDLTGGNPLYGVIGLSLASPGPSSAAALVEFGPGISFGSNLVRPFFPGDTDFSAPLIYAPQIDVFDAYPVGGQPVADAATYVEPAVGVGFIQYEASNPAYGGLPGYSTTNETLKLGAASAGQPYSAYVATMTGPALILANNGTGANGELVLNDRSGGANGGATTLVGEVGKDPRKLRCRAGICAVTNFVDGSLSIVLWDGSTGATVTGNVAVGAGPVDLDLVPLNNGDVGIVSTGFNDNSVSETEVAPDGSVVSSTTAPVPTGCTQPAHAAYFTDSDGLKFAATCYGSGNYFVALSTLNGR